MDWMDGLDWILLRRLVLLEHLAVLKIVHLNLNRCHISCGSGGCTIYKSRLYNLGRIDLSDFEAKCFNPTSHHPLHIIVSIISETS